MKRGTKEFEDIKKNFEKGVKEGQFGYISSDLTPDNFSTSTFYANGEVNTAFKVFMAGYACGRCEYLN